MIVVKSTLNKNDVNKFYMDSMKKYWWLFLIISLFFITFGIFAMLFPEDLYDKVLGIVLIIVGALFPLLIILLAKFMNKKNIKSSKFISDDMMQTFKFCDENMQIEQKSSLLFSDCVYDWSLVYKVTESISAFYIYVSNMQSLIVNKNDFVEGTSENLTALLIMKCGMKYKQFKGKR